jgi:hypothetical protein
MHGQNPSYDRVALTIELLEREHDVIRLRLPLSYGIRDQLIERRNDLHPADIADALGRIVNSKPYLEACLKDDAWRHDLDKKPVEPVSIPDRDYARLRLLMIRDEEREAEIDGLRQELRQLQDRLYEIERRGPE